MYKYMCVCVYIYIHMSIYTYICKYTNSYILRNAFLILSCICFHSKEIPCDRTEGDFSGCAWESLVSQI